MPSENGTQSSFSEKTLKVADVQGRRRPSQQRVESNALEAKENYAKNVFDKFEIKGTIDSKSNVANPRSSNIQNSPEKVLEVKRTYARNGFDSIKTISRPMNNLPNGNHLASNNVSSSKPFCAEANHVRNGFDQPEIKWRPMENMPVVNQHQAALTNDMPSKTVLDLNKLEINSIQDKVKLTAILAHSKIKVIPLENRLSAPFTPSVFKSLERFQELYTTQAYAWKHLMRTNSVILVDSRASGKTLAYLPAVCSLIQNSMGFNPSNPSEVKIGPSAIIVCRKSHIEKIVTLCDEFMKQYRRVSPIVVKADHSGDLRRLVCQLYNGCTFCITTPQCLVQAFEKNPNLLRNPDKLNHLIIDNIDSTFDECSKDYEKILNFYKDQSSLQVVVTSRTWNPYLLRFANIANNPLLLIGNHMEAFLYAKPSINVKRVSEADKMMETIKYLKTDKYLKEKTIIICNTDSDVETVCIGLKENEIRFSQFTTASTTLQLSRADNWCINRSEKFGVVVCSDYILNDMNIRCAKNVVHFSLPERFPTFLFRFSASVDCYHNYIVTETLLDGPPVSALILLDENNNMQLPKLIDLMGRLKCRIPQEVTDLSEDIRKQISDINCKFQPICNYFVMFGYQKCDDQCELRHWLSREDAPTPDLPNQGTVIVQIWNVNSPTNYSVRVMKHKDVNGTTWSNVNRSNEFLMFNLRLSSYYKNDGSLPVSDGLNVGDLYVVFHENKPFRCELIKKHKRTNHRTEELQFDVRLIDCGKIVKCSDASLFDLTDEFRDFPRQSTDVHLVGVIPSHGETVWNNHSVKGIKKLFESSKLSEKGTQFEANIVLSLKNSLFIDQLRVTQKSNTLSCTMLVASIKKEIVDKKIGISKKSGYNDFKTTWDRINK